MTFQFYEYRILFKRFFKQMVQLFNVTIDRTINLFCLAISYRRKKKTILCFSFLHKFLTKLQVRLLIAAFIFWYICICKFKSNIPLHRNHMSPYTFDSQRKNEYEKKFLVVLNYQIKTSNQLCSHILDVLKIEYRQILYLLIELRFSNLDLLVLIIQVLDNVLQKHQKEN